MKKNVHPKYQKVLFIDSASGHKFLCGSTIQPDAKEKFEGVEYPVVYLSISSSSHPFFTGSKQLVDSEGRVERFKRRFEKKKEEVVNPDEAVVEAAAAEETKKEAPGKKAAGTKPAAPAKTASKARSSR